MKDPVTFMEDILSSFKKNKRITICATFACIAISLGAIILAFRFAKESEGHIFVVDQGYVLAANRQDNAIQKDMEVASHVRRFHELMYNLAPNTEAIEANVSMASALGVEVASVIDADRKEDSFYTQLIQLPAVEEIKVDSVKVDVSVYPYRARTWATLYFIRPSNVAKYYFQSYSELVNSRRSESNPHGLTIEKFVVEKQTRLETTTRR